MSKRDGSARAQIITAAQREFSAHGFAGASLNRVLAEVGVPKGVFYYHFEDKEDLLHATVEQVLGDSLKHLALPKLDALTKKTFWPTLERLVREWTALAQPHRALLSAMREVDGKLLRRGRAVWRQVIEAGQRVGCVRSDMPVAMLVALVEGADHALDAAFFEAHQRPTRQAFAVHVERVLDTFERLLREEGSKP